MERAEVINNLLKLFPDPDYLEVGVWRGDTFFACNARTRTAVDPSFDFDVAAAQGRFPNDRYYATTSDQFFASQGAPERYDVIFLDGLHTFSQTLRDLQNSLLVMKPRGFIVLDDVLPDNYASSFPDRARSRQFRTLVGESGDSWMGDVFKVVFFIASYMPGLSFGTVSENHGQTILWRYPRAIGDNMNLGLSEINSFDFADTAFRREIFNVLPLDGILSASSGRF